MLMLDQTPLTSTPTCGRNHRNGRAVWTETGGRFPPKSEGGFRRNMQSSPDALARYPHQRRSCAAAQSRRDLSYIVRTSETQCDWGLDPGKTLFRAGQLFIGRSSVSKKSFSYNAIE